MKVLFSHLIVSPLKNKWIVALGVFNVSTSGDESRATRHMLKNRFDSSSVLCQCKDGARSEWVHRREAHQNIYDLSYIHSD